MTTLHLWLARVGTSRAFDQSGSLKHPLLGKSEVTPVEVSRMKLKFVVLFTSAAMLFGALFIVPLAHPQTAAPRIEITAKRFEFTPAEITLKKGDPVLIVLKSVDVAHGLRFRELGFDMKAGKGQTSEKPFTPMKTGDFIGQCSVFCGTGHGGMKLTLHVVE